MMESPTPSSLGFFMPAEWQPHEATWLSWPKDPLTFPEKILPWVEKIYCRMVAGLQPGEKVRILVDDEPAEKNVRKTLLENGAEEKNVIFHLIKSVDVWMRDYGPTFLLNRKGNKRGAVRWIFNAWGNKYDDLLWDNASGDAIAKTVAGNDFPVFRPGIVMEGGSIDVNGEGMLITTEQCLLNRNRNPALGKRQIEQYLRDYLGVSGIIWLKDGIAGDDTDGHVDDFCRFADRKKVLCASEKNQNDANYAILEENLRILKEHGLEVMELPMPAPIIDAEENRRLPASYANFYVGNKAVLLPVFGDENDGEAVRVLEECFPKREILPINCRELVYGYGGIHCVTQQQPK